MAYSFDLHGLSCSMIGVEVSEALAGLEADMFVRPVLTLLCTAAVAFYVRFLVALCMECKPCPSGFWVRLRLDAGVEPITERNNREIPAPRAA
jgi:hypothetical protein